MFPAVFSFLRCFVAPIIFVSALAPHFFAHRRIFSRTFARIVIRIAHAFCASTFLSSASCKQSSCKKCWYHWKSQSYFFYHDYLLFRATVVSTIRLYAFSLSSACSESILRYNFPVFVLYSDIYFLDTLPYNNWMIWPLWFRIPPVIQREVWIWITFSSFFSLHFLPLGLFLIVIGWIIDAAFFSTLV